MAPVVWCAAMGAFAEYESYDAVGLAELVAKGEVSAEDLLDSAIMDLVPFGEEDVRPGPVRSSKLVADFAVDTRLLAARSGELGNLQHETAQRVGLGPHILDIDEDTVALRGQGVDSTVETGFEFFLELLARQFGGKRVRGIDQLLSHRELVVLGRCSDDVLDEPDSLDRG